MLREKNNFLKIKSDKFRSDTFQKKITQYTVQITGELPLLNVPKEPKEPKEIYFYSYVNC